MGNIENNKDVNANSFANKKFIIKIVGIILIICVLILGGYFVYGKYKNYEIRKDPAKWVIHGYSSDYASNTIATSSVTKMKITMPQDTNSDENNSGSSESKMMISALQNLSVETKTMANRKMNQGYYDLNIKYKNSKFIDLKLFVDKAGIVVSSPDLYDKNIFINWKDISKLNKESSSSSKIDFDKYKSILTNDNSKLSDNYTNTLSEKLKPYIKKGGKSDVTYDDVNGKNKTISTDEVDLSLTNSEISSIVNDIISKASDDPEIKTLVKNKAKQFLAIVEKNNDYKKLGFTKSESNNFINKFDKNYDEMTKKIKSSLKSSKVSNASGNVVAKFKLDSNNKLKQIDYEVKLSGNGDNYNGVSIDETTTTKIDASDSDVKIQTLSRSDAEDLSNMDEYKQQDMSQQIESNLQKRVTNKLMSSGL